MIRYILATLYLAIGLAVALIIVPTAIFMAGLAGKSDGISFSSSDGVHVMRFHSDPGNLMLIAHGSTPGDKVLDFATEGNEGSNPSTAFHLSSSAQLAFRGAVKQ